MRRDVVRLGALDFILRIVLARVVGMSFVVEIFCVYLDDCAADMAGLRVPGHVIADFESLHDVGPAVAVSARCADSGEPWAVRMLELLDRSNSTSARRPSRSR